MSGADDQIQARIRRFSVLRAAERALRPVISDAEAASNEETGRRLLHRLQAISGSAQSRAEIIDASQALQAIDGLLERFATGIRDRLQSVPMRQLCDALDSANAAGEKTLRALGAVAIEGNLRDPDHLPRIELIATLLCVQGPSGQRRVVRNVHEALPELTHVPLPEAHEAHPDIDEAEQIFGRAIFRLDRDDAGAARDRILAYKRRLGPRILHPSVLNAAIHYNKEMSNRLARFIDNDRALDALADTLLGVSKTETRVALTKAAALARPRPDTRPKGRLLWQTLATAGLAIGLLCVAVWLWPRSSVLVLPEASTQEISPYLSTSYVSEEDAGQHFVGTVDANWHALDIETRRKVVARIAAVLAGRGIQSLTLIGRNQAMEARFENQHLLWLSEPSSSS